MTPKKNEKHHSDPVGCGVFPVLQVSCNWQGRALHLQVAKLIKQEDVGKHPAEELDVNTLVCKMWLNVQFALQIQEISSVARPLLRWLDREVILDEYWVPHFTTEIKLPGIYFHLHMFKKNFGSGITKLTLHKHKLNRSTHDEDNVNHKRVSNGYFQNCKA